MAAAAPTRDAPAPPMPAAGCGVRSDVLGTRKLTRPFHGTAAVEAVSLAIAEP